MLCDRETRFDFMYTGHGHKNYCDENNPLSYIDFFSSSVIII